MLFPWESMILRRAGEDAGDIIGVNPGASPGMGTVP